MDNIVNIDGSLLEGGGQMIRMSVGLASLLDRNLRIYNIRGNRSKPGLKAQHLAGINLVLDMIRYKLREVSGVELHSKEIKILFKDNYSLPKKINRLRFKADVKTAGAITLLSQISIPVALFLNCETVDINLKGGTNVDMAPNIDYYDLIFKPHLELFGGKIDIQVIKKGYFPKGGGEVNLRVYGMIDKRCLNPIHLEDGMNDITSVDIYSSVAGRRQTSLSEAKLMAESAESTLQQKLGTDKLGIVTQHAYTEDNYFGNGSSITLVSRTSSGRVFGGSAVVGSTNKSSPEVTGRNAAEDIINNSLLHPFSCVDSYIQDQIIIYMALAKGRSKIITGPLTLHSKSAIYIAEKFTMAKFEILENSDKNVVTILCDGIGYSNPN